MKTRLSRLALLSAALFTFAPAAMADQYQTVEKLSLENEKQVIDWRHHFHQFPELSNREFNTAKTIAKELKAMGYDVQTGIAHTGVVAVLDSGKPGPVIALRADIDGLPVTESVDLDFASKVTTQFNGEQVGVMHACGHDTHIAMLLGAAKILKEMQGDLTGQVKFIFQPAEEGAPAGEEGGAELMVKEGVMKGVDVVFGLHISSDTDVGTIEYKPGGIMAAVDTYRILVKGKQSHGAYPWISVDPIVTSAQIIMGLQTIVSRELSLIDEAAVVTVGKINGGTRSNIIPSEVEIVGTLRSLNTDMRMQIREAVTRKAQTIAASMNAEVDVQVPWGANYPVTYNEPALMEAMLPTIRSSAGAENVKLTKAVTGAEDFSFFQQEVPGLYLFVGGKSKDLPTEQAPGHHTPEFEVDDSGLKTGVEVLINLTIDYMKMNAK